MSSFKLKRPFSKSICLLVGIVVALLMISSCKPIHFLTRLKRTPRNYTLNYCGENIRAPKTEFNKETWIVFSDRDNNPTYRNPGGKVKMKQFNFMDAFFVMKKKGEFYQLIKYDAAVVDNLYSRKLKDKKKAEYCGWIHESRLLLTRHTTTDIASGFKDKQLSLITDSTLLFEPNAFFVTDSIITFRDANLSATKGTIPFYSLIYTLKNSLDQKKTLVARKTTISPDSAKEEVLGWIPSTLIRPIGQRLFTNLKTLPQDSLVFKNKIQTDTIIVSPQLLDEHKLYSNHIPTFKYHPVHSYCKENADSISLKVGIPIPIVDNSHNYVFNVNGNQISYTRFKELQKELRRLNIVFVFEGREKVIQSYAETINSIQNLQPLFENKDDVYSYKFGVVVATQGKTAKDEPTIKSSGILTNYTHLLDFLIAETDTKHQHKPLPTQYAWRGVKKAVEMIEPFKDETNLFVIIGETGYSEWADSALVSRMADLNCRIIGFQMHGVEENAGNNFVLQIENMIQNYAKKQAVLKREKIVYADQIKPFNRFRESSKNVYALDFPKRSMSQGWVLFPEKGIDLPLNMLANSIDTLICEVVWDNNNLISSMQNAFNTVGNRRFLYDTVFAKYTDIKDRSTIHKDLPNKFSKDLSLSYLSSQNVKLSDSTNRQANYYLLLSEKELDELVVFVEKLSAIEVDYKYKGKKRRIQKKCNCPDDDLIQEELVELVDSTYVPEYMSTRKLRRKLVQTYLAELRNCRLCKRSKRELLAHSLNEGQRLITGSPAYTSLLDQYQIKDIKNKKRLPDAELDRLIEHFKQKKDNLVRLMSVIEKFESNGETYYWIEQHMLP